MLTSDQFDTLTPPILSIFHEYEISVIKDIARRLKNLDFASAAWQVQRLSESGALYQDVLKQLAKLTGQSEKEIADILQRAGVKTITFDDKIYKDAGLNPLPLNLSPAMLQTLKAGIEKTNGVIENLTKTTVLTAQQSFIQASNLAYMQVSTGAMDYNSAIRMAIKDVASQGLDVIDYASGHQDKLDVAVRRNVLTGVAQTANQLQINRADEMQTDLVQVSAHAGARNKGVGPENHESWQGKIYSRSGKHPKYPNFVEVTGYGTGEGLGGWNCRHSFFPYFENISESAYEKSELRSLAKQKVKYNDQTISLYDATQIQREIERKIRFWKRTAEALDAAGLDNAKELAKISGWQARMRDFITETGLDRQRIREQVQ
jgi:Phage minor capsid protein 2.